MPTSTRRPAPAAVPVCTPKSLPPHLALHAADVAIAVNPANAPHAPNPGVAMALGMAPGGILTPQHIAVYTTKRWKPGTVLTVGFLENVTPQLKALILGHMNAWSAGGVGISFVSSTSNPTIRITLSGDGYWSYLGTDILTVPYNEPTMCLQGWSTRMPESECRRVIRHEVGHTLGSPHEHARSSIVALLDPAKTIAVFGREQGWSPAMVREQILTPLDESEVTGTTPDQTSIMAYQFSGSCTKDGKPIPGGSDINADDLAFMRSVYPGTVAPPEPPVVVPPPPPPIILPPAPPPSASIPVLTVGGPPLDATIGPATPGKPRPTFAFDSPGNAYTVLIRASYQTSPLDGFLRLTGTVKNPAGKPSAIGASRGLVQVTCGAAGRFVVELDYPLVRKATVRLGRPV